MADPADLTIEEAASLLARRSLSSIELTSACLERIRERDGVHSFDGDPSSINAWIRVYEQDALAAAKRSDERLAKGPQPPLCGIPIGLKDLFAVAGKPLTASSRLLSELPSRSSDVWQRLEAAGMVLLGHLHTHEFAAGATTDQVANPWNLERSAGGSSGGSAAALAAGTVAAATGTDTAGSLRIPAALCGVSTIKPTRGLVSLRGVVPLSPSLDHAGPMARTLGDCALLLDAMAGPDAEHPCSALMPPSQAGAATVGARSASLRGARIAVSPRLSEVALGHDVEAGLERVLELCRELGARLVGTPRELAGEVLADHSAVESAGLLAYHRRFSERRYLYRPAVREFVEAAESRALCAADYAAAQMRRRELSAGWADWMARERIRAVVEPTVPVLAPRRGRGYEKLGADDDLIALTYYWNWVAFPVAAFPAGAGTSGLPVSVSLIGAPGFDRELLRLGAELQSRLGAPELPPRSSVAQMPSRTAPPPPSGQREAAPE